jgi:hypothetical protein
MAELTHRQYDALEHAVANATRIVVYRRGTEYVVVPSRLYQSNGREAIEARHPTTGDSITFYIDEVDGIDVVG